MTPKVLLINPPVASPHPVLPLGLAYLAAALRANGVAVSVLDAWAEHLDFAQLARRAAAARPDLVGVTMMTPVFENAMRTVSAAKRATGAPVAVGGPHPSALPEECLQLNPDIDYVAIGEGDRTIVALAEVVAGRRDPASVKGLAFRSAAGVQRTGPPDLIKNLDELPLPARDLFPNVRYRSHPPYGRKSPYFTLMTTRGCPFRCVFCSKAVFGDRYRTAGPDHVVDELEHVLNAYGAKEVRFYDDDFTINMARAEAICDEMIDRGIAVDWSCTTRVDLVNDRLLAKMRQAGCWAVSYGVESGSPGILEAAGKKYTLHEVRTAFRLTKQHGMRTLGFFMLGLPGETEETVRQTIALAFELEPDFISWATTMYLPGSKLYAQRPPLRPEDVALDLRSDRHPVAPLGATPWNPLYEGALPAERLAELGRDAHRAFYLRPSYVLRTAAKVTSLGELGAYAAAGLQLARNVVKARIAGLTGERSSSLFQRE